MNVNAIETAVDKLIAALRPHDPRVAALGKGRSDSAIRELVHSVLQDTALDSKIIILALWLARVFPDPTIITDIIHVIGRRPDVAILAGDALSHVGSGANLSELATVLVDSSAAVESRLGAARALAQWRDKRAGAILTTGLYAALGAESIQSEIIQALSWATMGADAHNTVRTILPYLRSESPNVRHATLVALGNLHAIDTMADVANLVDDPGVTTRGEFVSREARRVLEKLKTVPNC
jgi:HEAT repeat protein